MTARKERKHITYRGGSVRVLLVQEGGGYVAELWSLGALVTRNGPFVDETTAERAWDRLAREATRLIANGQLEVQSNQKKRQS